MTSARTRGAVAAAAGLLLLASCGGGGGGSAQPYQEPAGPATENLTVQASNFAFTPDKLDASPGIAEIKLTDAGGIHTLVFDGTKGNKVPGFMLEVSGSGDSQSLKVDLKPGKYVFYCNVDSHRQQGMQGTITVK
jgi:plastocyanin